MKQPTSGGSTRGLMAYTVWKIFYKVKPPDLSIEKLRLRMDKYAQTGFTRFLYSIGSEASLEKR